MNTARDGEADQQVKRLIEKAFLSAHHIERQLAFTRDYEDIGVHSPIWQDIRTVISDVMKNLDFSPIVIHIEITDVEIFADPLLEKVFNNLIDNSKKYGQTITKIRFSGEERDERYFLICEDDGVGIPDEFKEKIFNREYYKHTGFGLNLTREILSITGLTIRECGEAGKGARFEIKAPKGGISDLFRE